MMPIEIINSTIVDTRAFANKLPTYNNPWFYKDYKDSYTRQKAALIALIEDAEQLRGQIPQEVQPNAENVAQAQADRDKRITATSEKVAEIIAKLKLMMNQFSDEVNTQDAKLIVENYQYYKIRSVQDKAASADRWRELALEYKQRVNDLEQKQDAVIEIGGQYKGRNNELAKQRDELKDRNQVLERVSGQMTAMCFLLNNERLQKTPQFLLEAVTTLIKEANDTLNPSPQQRLLSQNNQSQPANSTQQPENKVDLPRP